MIVCSPQLGISPVSNLGGEVHDREILKALANEGVEIEIILPLGKKHDDHKNWKIYNIPIPFVYPPWLFNFYVLPYLFILYFKNNFSIIRVHSPEFVGFAAVFFKKFFPDVKIVATFHHLDKDQLSIWANKFLIGKFDLVTVATEQTRQEYLKLHNNTQEQKVVIIPHGISELGWSEKKNGQLVKEHNLKNKKVLLYFGQLISRKNLSFTLDVLTLLPSEFVLIIAGDGPEKDNLVKKSKSLGITNRVIFTGMVPEESKSDYYNLADIFVFPSLLEGFGMSIVEAQKCGRVVIVSPNPVFSDFVIDNKTGLVEELDAKKWAARISQILSDQQKIKLISKNAQIVAQKFTWQSSAKKYLDAIKNL